ncbi:hypothetical protein JX266_012521 [Neoarthrinium moseri]|uniref:uncharacterized protein n=1 Tax=Neoarthrinium moseri TaxID=1658444 RepID=UPI001FDDFF28|nr:uncharacterized protein JN550_012300 [Neoarthrinium moseri]KAI1841285.1 hypothetical protein JX266_012521 [Neoarthrinium moseri]KAI1858942.1 hypothetical protein JN550_012300 [Neoarthrinium moseri]
MWDYIVVGGGLAGSVVTNRLLKHDASLRILVLEAGPDVSNRTDILYVNSTNLIQGDFDYNYQTVPQVHLDNRQIGNSGGRALGGGSAINTCGWTRGPRLDYDLWAQTVGDDRWSYDGQLPYFRSTEDWCDDNQNPDQHGHEGPLYVASVSSTGRQYPLRDQVEQSWHEIGVETIPELDGNAGNTLGVSELFENRRDGKRQIASVVYPLNGATVLTNTLVDSIIIEKDSDGNAQATGVRLANGIEYKARQVIASAGAYRTPQLLMLSGIGPSETLLSLGIETKLDLPDVGKGLADHVMFSMFWKLKNPELGYAIGSSNPLFQEPQFGLGNANNFITSTAVPKDGLAEAIAKDEGRTPDPTSHPLLKDTHAMMENFVLYLPLPAADPILPTNGTWITTTMVGLQPTSKGSVTISSKDPKVPPVIDPNYFATEVDKYVWRESIRQMVSLVSGNQTVLGRDIIEVETPPSSFDPINSGVSDEYLDARVRTSGISTYHGMGTCAMGKVVDANLKVKGVQGLFVVDASVFPVVLGAHIQAATYALAEQAAGIISTNSLI